MTPKHKTTDGFPVTLMPQVGEAGRDGWPEGYADKGMEATREFFGATPQGRLAEVLR